MKTVVSDMFGTPALRPAVKRGSASQQLHESLRSRIVSLDLEPGHAISRAEIAAEYRVSLTPVRDALIKLEQEGLIETFPQSKTEVSRIDLKHAQETHMLRLSVELEIVRRIAQMSEKDTTRAARSLLAQQSAARDVGDFASFARLDRAFHLSLYQVIGMENLYDVIEARSGHIDRLRNLNLPDPGKVQSILDCHGRILDAIEAGDADAACAALREHLSGTLKMVDAIRERYGHYF